MPAISSEEKRIARSPNLLHDSQEKMNHPRIVTENKLDTWVRDNAQIAQGRIVELVWRLVAASCPSPNRRHFPLGDSIGQHGADGELDTEIGLPPFVPKGRSFWEIGTGINPSSKATSDYRGLTNSVPEMVRRQSSFIFVTPLSGRRGWPNTWDDEGISSWVEVRRQQKDWSDVIVLNGARLVDWLYAFPSVERWLAGVMGLQIEFIETLDGRWETLGKIGEPPPLPCQLFTSNRETAATKLHQIIFSRDVSQLKLDTKHPRQCADFISAYASSLPDGERAEAIGRCLIVTNEEAWQGVCSLQESHILVADFEIESDRGVKLIQAALNRRHAVVFTGLPGGPPHSNRVPLPLPKSFQIMEALERAGYPSERARRLANACNSDLSMLLRSIQGLSIMPEWAQRSDAGELAIAMLIGGWEEQRIADENVIEQLSGKPYGEWIKIIRSITAADLTPLNFRNESWRFSPRFEGWKVLGSRITSEQLNRFIELAVRVLREFNPELDLEPEERYSASVYGKVREHSKLIRNNIAESLALLGAESASLTSCRGEYIKRRVAEAVRGVLDNGSWQQWAGSDDVLPMLAEASPNTFLDTVSSALKSKPSPFVEVFQQERPGVLGRSYMSGMLWALELLAWSDKWLTRSCMLLAELAAIDPGGNWVNRPINSLRDIFLPWFPQTCASAEKRHSTVKAIATLSPQIGWRLAFSLLTSPHSHTTGTFKPTWRDFVHEDWSPGAEPSQQIADEVFYGKIAFDLAANDVNRLAELAGIYFQLPLVVRVSLREHLVALAGSKIEDESRYILWQTINSLTRNHRKFADSEYWKVGESALKELEDVAAKLRPVSLVHQNKRLFSDNESDLFEDANNYDAEQMRLSKLRQEAVKDILEEGGEDALFDFAMFVDLPWKLGGTYGELTGITNDSKVLPHLLSSTGSDDSLVKFAGGYVWSRFKAEGWGWVDSIGKSQWSSQDIGQFFVFLPFCAETWNRVTEALGDLESAYWSRTSFNPNEADEGIELGLSKLLAYDRPDAVVSCMQFMLYKRGKLPHEIAVNALDALNDSHRLDGYAIAKVLSHLQQNAPEFERQLCVAEWNFMSILGGRNCATPYFLVRHLAEDHRFFCQVLHALYKAKNLPHQEALSKGELQNAERAYRLLDEWDRPPGTMRDDSYSGESLNEWIIGAKTECVDSGRWEVASLHIGRVLLYAPKGEDGLWIDPVCVILDEADHDYMRRGVVQEIFNSRGTYTPDGGNWERAAAERWHKFADCAELKGYCQIAQKFFEFAESYLEDADRELRRSSDDED